MEWWTLEVIDAPDSAASSWQTAYSEQLVEAAVTHGVQEWAWVTRPWGVILEVSFLDESDWLRFRGTPVVAAALDAVPDPVHGLLVYQGRGGGSGAAVPRRPHPAPLSGGAALPEPASDEQPEPWLGRQHARLPVPA